jgi:hypothetical protein
MTPSKKPNNVRRKAARAGPYRYNSVLQAEIRREQAMADDRAVSAGHVREVILADLDRQNGQSAGAWTVDDRVIKGRDSWIFRAESPHAPFPLALKVYCTAVEPDVPVRQGELLRQFHDATADRRDFAVPMPWAVLPDHRTLVMEWIEAPGLDKLLQGAGRRGEERQRLLSLAGRWLRHFHERSGVELQPLKSHQLQKRVDLQLGGEPGAGLKVRDQAFRKAYAVLLEGVAEFDGAPLPHATAHGDFQAKNLLHGPLGTVGIDLTGFPNTPVTNDMFQFLVHAEVEKPFLSRGMTGIEGPNAQAFLTAYGAMEHLDDARLMSFLYLAATLVRWAHRIKLLRLRRYRIFRVGQALRLRHMANHALSRLEPRLSE